MKSARRKKNIVSIPQSSFLSIKTRFLIILIHAQMVKVRANSILCTYCFHPLIPLKENLKKKRTPRFPSYHSTCNFLCGFDPQHRSACEVTWTFSQSVYCEQLDCILRWGVRTHGQRWKQVRIYCFPGRHQDTRRRRLNDWILFCDLTENLAATSRAICWGGQELRESAMRLVTWAVADPHTQTNTWARQDSARAHTTRHHGNARFPPSDTLQLLIGRSAQILITQEFSLRNCARQH